MLFPDQGGAAEYGYVLVLYAAQKQLYLAFEYGHHVLLHVAEGRFEDEVARVGQTAEEDERLGRGYGHKVGQCRAERASRALESLQGYGVVLGCRLRQHLGLELLVGYAAQLALAGHR